MVVVEMVMATGPQKLARALLDNHIIFLRRGRLWLRMMPSFRFEQTDGKMKMHPHL